MNQVIYRQNFTEILQRVDGFTPTALKYCSETIIPNDGNCVTIRKYLRFVACLVICAL